MHVCYLPSDGAKVKCTTSSHIFTEHSSLEQPAELTDDESMPMQSRTLLFPVVCLEQRRPKESY